MSHGLTVPEANQSPYPLQEPPHTHKPEVKSLPPVTGKKNKPPKQEKRDKDDKRQGSTSGGALALIGAALGLGALAIGAVLYERQSEPAKKKGKKGGKR